MDSPASIQLRPVQPSDLPIFYEQQLDPAAAAMADFPSRGEADFMAHWEKITRDESVLLRTVLADEQVAGNLVSFVMEGHREVGYWFGREFWGRGVATRALAAFLLEETRRPLHAFVSQRNPASRHVLEKCGFIFDNEQENWLVFRLGEE